MLVYLTDFGRPYLAQMQAAVLAVAPDLPQLSLFEDLPAYDPRAAARLIDAYLPRFPAGTVFVCVVDPGVGGPRRPLAVRIDGRWLLGPDNGLFDTCIARAVRAAAFELLWRPPALSASFHGRDLFAPAAARIAAGAPLARRAIDLVPGRDAGADLSEVIYVDGFGNCFTGLRADRPAPLLIGTRRLPAARTFGDVAPGEAFCYVNSVGLLEIAVNQGNAARQLDLRVGTPLARA